MSRCKRNTSRMCPEHSKLHFWLGNGHVKIILRWGKMSFCQRVIISKSGLIVYIRRICRLSVCWPLVPQLLSYRKNSAVPEWARGFPWLMIKLISSLFPCFSKLVAGYKFKQCHCARDTLCRWMLNTRSPSLPQEPSTTPYSCHGVYF